MADEQDKWLDRAAAERLLRGERLDGVAHHDREQAERLAETLAALSAPKPAKTGADGELPGESGALAAFRAARGGDTWASEAAPVTPDTGVTAGATGASGAVSAGVGTGAGARDVPGVPEVRGAVGAPAAGGGDEPVRIGAAAARPVRWGRPVRLGIAAALAACMAGGVAVAAGAGVIPSPFQRAERAPATSASPLERPERPLRSPSTDKAVPPDEVPDDESSAPEEDPSDDPERSVPPKESETSEGTGGDERPEATENPGPGAESGERGRKNGRKWYRHVVSACRDYRSGALGGDKRRSLEEAARGADRVREFCDRLLDGKGGKGGKDDEDEDGQQGGEHGRPGGGDDDDDDDSGHGRPGGGGQHGGRPGGVGHVPPVTLPHHPRPAPSYSAAPVF
ncbi:hypothetical protein RB200_30260 [Streptomyces sp. PmtG]